VHNGEEKSRHYLSVLSGLLQRALSQKLKQGFKHLMVTWMLMLRNTNSNIHYYSYLGMVGYAVAVG
jgi:hypothetical protein